MSTTTATPAASKGSAVTSKAFALGLIAVIMMLILPVPALVLDIMLAVSITVSVLVFLLAVNFGDPVEFSTFPSVLLVTTTLRLSLNIASTRLILLGGHKGPSAAGHVIESFGNFVVGGSYIVGIIVFLILVIINFKVITEGAGRISEVAARFTLDAMPGKQMAIDNELANGHITEGEARTRRQKVADEADFYGAMDGANKFVKGDAVAGLIIAAINIVGGIVIGVAQGGLSLADAAQTYTILTVGDGLVSQIPALLVSTAAGLIASRTASGQDLGNSLVSQVLGRPEPLQLAGIALGALAIIPGMPTVAFLVLGGGCLVLSRRAKRRIDEAEAGPPEAGDANANRDAEPTLPDLLAVDLLAFEVGFDLVAMVDKNRGGELLQRITQIRKQLARELGVVVPPIRVRDNLQLASGEYRLLLSGTPVGGGELRPQKMMAIDAEGGAPAISGERTKDPAFGLPALWVAKGDRERAELLGYTVVDPPSVAATHLTELLRSNAADFMGRAEAQEIVDAFAAHNPKLVEEVIPTIVTLGELIAVLKRLLGEGISIRDMRTVLEAIADHAGQTKDPEALTELVRQRMRRALSNRHQDGTGHIHALVLDPQVEAVFRPRMGPDGHAVSGPDPGALPRVLRGLERALGSMGGATADPVVVTAPDIRPTFAALTSRHAPGLAVLSFREIDPTMTVKTAGIVRLAA